jgi:hypothetical protein
MKAVWIIIVFCLTTFACASQPEQGASNSDKDALEVISKTAAIVDAQLAAYNKQDLDALLNFFHPDIESYNSIGERQLQGIEALRETFANQFNHKPNEAVVERIVDKNYVIDKVEVTFVVDGQAMTQNGVVIYTIEDDLIRRMTFL